LAEGFLIDQRRTWLVYTVKPVVGTWGAITGKGHFSPDFHSETGELRGIGAGVEPDGSLKFVEGRVNKYGPNGDPEMH